MRPVTLLLAASSPLLAYSFSNTAPLVTWSSSSTFLDTLPVVSASDHVLNDILSADSACSHKAIIIIDQPGLHASHLRTLPSSSGLSTALAHCKSNRQYPYLKRDMSQSTFDIAERLSAKCNAQILTTTIGEKAPQLLESTKHVVHVNVPAASLDTLEDSTAALFEHLDSMLSKSIEHLVLFTGSSPIFSKRADDGAPVFEFAAPKNGTLVEGGIFKRYQLFTPGLILSLFIVFFVLVPIMMVGVNALNSIQSPIRLDAPKNFSAQDKKQQ